MSFRQLVVLLPCQSLESFSLDRDARDAEELLAGWSALYHPVLLAHAEGMPGWVAAETPPEDPAASLIVLPGCCESLLPTDWLARAAAAGARVLRGLKTRESLVAAALERLPEEGALSEDEGLSEEAAAIEPDVEPDLVADFLALGFCHLQVELLTRQLRYSSNLDHARFGQHAQEGARAALAGDATAAREHLQAAFDRLTEAREYFYPTETHLLDLTLVASTTLGEDLHAELGSGSPGNYLVSGEVLDEMARRDPEALAQLRQRLEKGEASLVGGEYAEGELPLLPIEEILTGLLEGLDACQRHLGLRPTLYGRRRFGLTPLLPPILLKLGFQGALHFTLDDGQFPTGNQSKIRWEGFDLTEIETLGRVPLDVRNATSYLRLAERLGNTVDVDQAATVVFAHWPSQSSPWHEDLRRVARYGSALGRFGTMGQYFESTRHSGRTTAYAAGKYRSPYLRQDVAAHRPDPISRWVQCHRDRAAGDALQAFRLLGTLLAAEPGQGLPERLDEALAWFCRLVAGPSPPSPGGFLLANPLSFPRRVCLDVSRLESLPEVAGPVLLAAEAARHKQVLVEIPPMGFAWVGPHPAGTPADHGKAATRHEPVARKDTLRNEYFEVEFDPHTGAIRSIHNYAIRGNRLGQQIAMRLSEPSQARRPGTEAGKAEEYSIMAADEVRVVESGPLVGRIESRGRLVDRDGHTLARFVQSTTAQRGSRILDLEIELDVDRQPQPDPWDSYYAARFAWGDDTAELYQGVGLTGRRCEENFLEAPHFLDLRSPRTRFTLLTGGLPYHRRYGPRKVDTLLVVEGETARRFRLGIGVDLTYGARAAVDFLDADRLHVQDSGCPPTPFAWLFHLDARNVTATAWEPLETAGLATGFRVRLLETEGRHTRLGLRSFFPLATARKVDFLGQGAIDLPVQGDRLEVSLSPHEWLQVEAEFAR